MSTVNSDQKELAIKAYYLRAEIENLIGKNNSAIEDVTRGIHLSKTTTITELQADGMLRLCSIYLDIGKYSKVLTLGKEAQAHLQQIKDIGGEGESLHKIGLAHYYTGNVQNALKLYKHIPYIITFCTTHPMSTN